MRARTIVPSACPTCGKQTSLAAIEPHPTHPEIELLTFRCEDCGPVRTASRPRGGIAPRGIMLEPGDANLGWGVGFGRRPFKLTSIGLSRFVK